MTDLPESSTPRSTSEIASFHAHIYYDPATTRPEAERLRAWIDERFSVTLGRWHDAKVGPHDQAMFQVAFGVDVFPVLVPWLMLNHGRLSILVHPTRQIRAGIIFRIRCGSDRHWRCTARSCRKKRLWSRRLYRTPRLRSRNQRPARSRHSRTARSSPPQHQAGFACLPIRPRWVKPNPAEYFSP
jgi:aromatic ring-cleaving dioxygenase